LLKIPNYFSRIGSSLVTNMQKIQLTTRNRALILLLSFAFSIIAINPILIPSSQAQSQGGDTFSIMQISDTQFLAGSFPQLFNDTTSWIVNNTAAYNLKMVIHTGDIVDNINATPSAISDPVQWDNANSSMSKLLSAGIPYCWDAGNHDQIPWNSPTGTWLGSSYAAFNATNMQSNTYWVSDAVDSKNTAVKFSYNGYNFLIINVEYMASNSTIAWMKNLLDINKGANVIIAAHTYLNKAGTYGVSSPGLPGEVAWCNSFKSTLDGYPNIFMTLSGHDPTGSANTTRIGNRQEIFFNRQVIVTSAGQTGAAAVRIYTFNLTSKTVDTKTYSQDTKAFLVDPFNQFTFNAALKLPLTTTATQSATTSYTGTDNWVSFTANPSGGVTPYTYQWFITTSQGVFPIGSNSNTLQYTTIAPSNYTFFCNITDAQGAITQTGPMPLVINAAPIVNPPTTPKEPEPPTSPIITQPPPNDTETPPPTSQTPTPPNSTNTIENSNPALSTTALITIAAVVVIGVVIAVTLVMRRQK
jgi:hypothetical protein